MIISHCQLFAYLRSLELGLKGIFRGSWGVFAWPEPNQLIIMGAQWTRGFKNTKVQLGFYILVLIFCWAYRCQRLERSHGQTTGMAGMKFFGADHPYIHARHPSITMRDTKTDTILVCWSLDDYWKWPAKGGMLFGFIL